MSELHLGREWRHLCSHTRMPRMLETLDVFAGCEEKKQEAWELDGRFKKVQSSTWLGDQLGTGLDWMRRGFCSQIRTPVCASRFLHGRTMGKSLWPYAKSDASPISCFCGTAQDCCSGKRSTLREVRGTRAARSGACCLGSLLACLEGFFQKVNHSTTDSFE